MIMLDQQAVTTILSALGTAVAVLGYLHTVKRDLQADINEKFDSLRHESNDKFDGLRHEFNNKFDSLRHESSDKFDSLRHEFNNLKSDLDEKSADFKKEFSEVKASLRVLEQRTFDLAYRHGIEQGAGGGNAATG